MDDKDRSFYFFEETFLPTEISMDVALGISFLILRNVEVNMNNQKLMWRSYITAKAVFISKKVMLIGKKEFATAVLDPEDDTFIVHIARLAICDMSKVHLSHRV